MHSPYTLDYAGSFFAAQSCAGLMLTALLLFWSCPHRPARAIALFAVWLAVMSNGVAPFEKSIGYKPGPDTLFYVLALAAGCGTAATAVARRWVLCAVAAVGQIPLWWIGDFVKDSDPELAALHLAWLGLLIGLLLRPPHPGAIAAPASPVEPSYRLHDAIVFTAAAVLSAVVCLAVMRRRDGTADEWAYTFQAAVFAKGRAYAAVPPCQPYLRNFYVFEDAGRLFAQYTPGWPLFMIPALWLGAPWVAGPLAMGLLAVGVARLGRSACRCFWPNGRPAPARVVAAAGTWAAALVAAGVMMTIEAGSRYPHIYATALYVWALEALMMVSASPAMAPAPQWRWGAALGSASALLVATRPAEGMTAGVGIAAAFVVALAQRRVGWRALAGAAGSFAFWAFVVLGILRLQLGEWFMTGYSLNAVIYPWNVTKYDMPRPDQWKYGLPLATSAYCWWPASLALGLAGLAWLRGPGLRLLLALALGGLVLVVYFEWLDSGQRGMGVDWGYGPRYLMLLVVPMAIGGGVAIAPLAEAARQRTLEGRLALTQGAPFALLLFAITSGWVRLVPLVWPTVFEHTRRHGALTRAIEEMHLKNAIVLARPGTTGFDVLDITTNLPVDLYPHQDAIIAVDKSADAAACLRRAFPDRALFSAVGVDPVRIAPY